MKRKQLTAISMVLVLAMVFSSSLFAQRGQGRNENGNKGNLSEFRFDGKHGMHRIPNLTEEQTLKMDELRVKHLKEKQEIRSLLDIKRAELRSLEIADKADMKAINAKIDEISGLQNKLVKTNAAHRQEVRSLLNADQKVYFDARNGRRNNNRSGRGAGNGRNFYQTGPKNGSGPRAATGDCTYGK